MWLLTNLMQIPSDMLSHRSLRLHCVLPPLSQSFSTISLENVAFHVKLSGGASEAEKYIRDMVGCSVCLSKESNYHSNNIIHIAYT